LLAASVLSSSTPPTTIGRASNSFTAAPSANRSGLKATCTSAAARSFSAIARVVPGGTVLFTTTSWPSRTYLTSASVASSMWVMSGAAPSPSGVPTVTITTSLSATTE
jgi:hypothetical protein